METIIRLEDELYPFQKEQLEKMTTNFVAENREVDTCDASLCIRQKITLFFQYEDTTKSRLRKFPNLQ